MLENSHRKKGERSDPTAVNPVSSLKLVPCSLLWPAATSVSSDNTGGGNSQRVAVVLSPERGVAATHGAPFLDAASGYRGLGPLSRVAGWANHQTVTRDTALKLKESLAWIGRQPVGSVSATMGMESRWRLIHPKVRKRGNRGRKGGANSLIVGRQVEGLTEGSARQVISWLTSRSRGFPFLEGLGRITRKKEGEEKAIVLNSDQIDRKQAIDGAFEKEAAVVTGNSFPVVPTKPKLTLAYAS
ncbi:uncharacterized protein BO96DRAFT_342145 [Aspergillus niger CBS 101883]|uniref:Contig An08c0230, genomic contig n=2 Tax=Aspergillus niger TaxID=5061 RepID=A5AB28_ASPNC|nr:uncharacterized protein BO96DRAFT_342145 [Aspergillus niger CBS 101883]XP_059606173.1 uncharacterized protein An08g08830 [Aspergillus niger]PYH54652.1 hypothetical protein BO96DRAFT_342145 [Aspergillus niger CBS 101883]CAK96662.1 unnamed protein product [Aspergillus niger]